MEIDLFRSLHTCANYFNTLPILKYTWIPLSNAVHAAEKVTLLDASILGDLSNALAEAQAVAAGGSAAGMAAVDAEDNSETEKIAAQLDDASLEETETPIEQSGSGFYSLEKLQTAPFPPGIDNAKRETYLEDEVFLSIFGMDKQSFAALPGWKRTAAKKKHKLF